MTPSRQSLGRSLSELMEQRQPVTISILVIASANQSLRNELERANQRIKQLEALLVKRSTPDTTRVRVERRCGEIVYVREQN